MPICQLGSLESDVKLNALTARIWCASFEGIAAEIVAFSFFTELLMMKRLSFLMVIAMFASANFAGAQIDPEDPDDLCQPEISSDGFTGTHCNLISIGAGSGMSASPGNCDLERDCSISSGTLILNYTGPADPNIDVISNEGIIPTITGGSSYEFDLTEVDDVPCGQQQEFTFSLIYYISGAPHVICELRHLFKCKHCWNEV